MIPLSVSTVATVELEFNSLILGIAWKLQLMRL